MRALLPVILPSLAWCYSLKKTDDGVPLRWPEGAVPYAIDEHGSLDVFGRSELGAVRAAMSTWNAIPGARVRLLAAPSTDDPPARVTWWQDWDDQVDALAVTVVTYDVETGDIVDAEIRINDEVEWTIADSRSVDGQRYDVQNTIAHEVGHLMGLAHSEADEQATMFPTSAPWEVIKRDLASDDLAGFAHLYGVGAPDDPSEPAVRTAGCHMAPSTAGNSAIVVLLGFAALVSRGRGLGTTVIGATLLWSSSHAAAVRGHSLAELVARADRVVVARVVESEAQWVGETIQTDTVVEVVDCLAGPCSERLVVRQPGGEVGRLGQSVEGSARLRVGDELLLFLLDHPATATTRPVGMAHGVFVVRGGSAMSLQETAPAAERDVPQFAIRDLLRLLAPSPPGLATERAKRVGQRVSHDPSDEQCRERGRNLRRPQHRRDDRR